MCAKLRTQKLLITGILSAAVFTAGAQSTSVTTLPDPSSSKENSPYSRYGLGMLSEQRQAIARGLGGAATALTDPLSVNSFNPASYSFLGATSFDFGVEGRSRSILMNNESTRTGTVTFSYLNIGFPMGKHAGMSFGFTPMTNLYYNMADSATIPGLGPTVRTYNGNGAVQYAYLGLSGKIKNFSAGVNFGYAFGNMHTANSIFSQDSIVPSRNAEFSTRNNMGGIYWKGGLLYKADLKKEQYLNIGATVTLSQQLNIKRDTYNIGRSYDAAGTLLSRDTLNQTYGAKGKLQMPAEYSFGVHWGKPFSWDIGADLVYSDWKNYSNFGVRDSIADNTWRLSLGGEVTPGAGSGASANGKYFSTVTYRMGVYYGTDYISLRGTQLNYMGASLGLSFPFRRSNTNRQMGRVHTIFEIGKRGTTENGLAREFYTKFTVALSLNDIWFIKRRLE